jgi:hypothetical protein
MASVWRHASFCSLRHVLTDFGLVLEALDAPPKRVDVACGGHAQAQTKASEAAKLDGPVAADPAPHRPIAASGPSPRPRNLAELLVQLDCLSVGEAMGRTEPQPRALAGLPSFLAPTLASVATVEVDPLELSQGLGVPVASAPEGLQLRVSRTSDERTQLLAGLAPPLSEPGLHGNRLVPSTVGSAVATEPRGAGGAAGGERGGPHSLFSRAFSLLEFLLNRCVGLGAQLGVKCHPAAERSDNLLLSCSSQEPCLRALRAAAVLARRGCHHAVRVPMTFLLLNCGVPLRLAMTTSDLESEIPFAIEGQQTEKQQATHVDKPPPEQLARLATAFELLTVQAQHKKGSAGFSLLIQALRSRSHATVSWLLAVSRRAGVPLDVADVGFAGMSALQFGSALPSPEGPQLLEVLLRHVTIVREQPPAWSNAY